MVKESNPWIEASDVILMFSTLIWKIQLKAELRKAMDVKMLMLVERMRQEEPELMHSQGWQSDQTLHEREDFRDLVACVNKAARSALRFLRMGYDAFEITGCWANVLAKGTAHRPHHHPNNFLSGVYYVRTQPGADTINFHDPRNQTGI
ncbi:MAG: TIGR02466 family protein, partial [Nitrospirota bacterium]|nr:TIGR02466 family protein [Nitrospirota bacterium]